MITWLINWWNGWRVDEDGWWVRPIRTHDPAEFPIRKLGAGFYNDDCVVVSNPETARKMG